MSKLLRMPEAVSLGLHAAVALAEVRDRPVSARELAARFGASEAHLAKVLQRLVKEGIVRSTRGPKGGFRLNRPADEVSLLEVYEAIEGPVEPWGCLFGKPVCGRSECMFAGYLEEFDARFRAYLARATLGALAAKGDTTDGDP